MTGGPAAHTALLVDYHQHLISAAFAPIVQAAAPGGSIGMGWKIFPLTPVELQQIANNRTHFAR